MGIWKVGLHWGKSIPTGCIEPNRQPRKYTYNDLVGTKLIIFRNTRIYACRYMNAITVTGRRGHEFKKK